MALAENEPALVIGETGLLSDRPGFEVEFLRRGSIPEMSYTSHRHEILMILAGHWRLSWSGGESLLSPGDTCAVPPGLEHSLVATLAEDAALYRVMDTDDPAGPTVVF
jgi:mannose-6-phosphate isomerase-like protein (cupin superfamily)